MIDTGGGPPRTFLMVRVRSGVYFIKYRSLLFPFIFKGRQSESCDANAAREAGEKKSGHNQF